MAPGSFERLRTFKSKGTSFAWPVFHVFVGDTDGIVGKHAENFCIIRKEGSSELVLKKVKL